PFHSPRTLRHMSSEGVLGSTITRAFHRRPGARCSPTRRPHGGAMELDRDETMKTLNEIVELELAGAVRYTQYSLMVFGHARIPIMGWMRQQATDDLAHASQAGEEVTSLGGKVSLAIGDLVGTHHDSV